MTDHPLDGITCVELSERGSAAYAGKLLRRFGASVVKVEGPEGDPLRSRHSRRREADGLSTTPAYDFFNEGKKIRRLDRPSEFPDLVRGVDAVVMDVHPDRFPTWGLEPDALGSLECRVVCSITPFGLSGPYSRYRGPELVTTSVGGMNVGIGEPGRKPLKMPFMQSALQGGLTGAIAVMGALYSDETEAPATVVEISEADVWATIHAGTTMVAFLFSNRLRKRAGHRVLGQPYPHQLFRCSDGWIAVQASERHQFESLVEMVGSPDFLMDRRFGSRMEMNEKHADEIDGLLAPWFEARTRQDIFEECRRRKIPAAPVRSIDEVRDDPELQGRGVFETYEGGVGIPVTVPAPPFRFREAETVPPGPVPRGEGG